MVPTANGNEAEGGEQKRYIKARGTQKMKLCDDSLESPQLLCRQRRIDEGESGKIEGKGLNSSWASC